MNWPGNFQRLIGVRIALAKKDGRKFGESLPALWHGEITNDRELRAYRQAGADAKARR